VRPLTADRLTIPCGEPLRPAEINHDFILMAISDSGKQHGI
jgi:hypothetical protein